MSKRRYRIYCDESCHLANDGQSAMVLGGVWCPSEKSREIAVRIREIKRKYGHQDGFELKWTKISKSQTSFYLALLDYFFDDDDLRFRALVIPDKSRLDHARFQQDHDTWYYKMYFNMLKVLISPHFEYEIYLDIKDTRSAAKIKKLHEVMCSSHYDFSRSIIKRVEAIHSHKVEQVQLADLLVGAVSYVNRGLQASSAKRQFVERMKERSGYSLTRSTLPSEGKCNVFIWRGAGDSV